MKNKKDKDIMIKRFGSYRITEHWVNALLFGVLVLTGLPQKFFDYELSRWIIMSLGGIDSARMIHRISGLLLSVLLLQHIIVALAGVLFFRWQPTMFISIKDYKDNIDNLKYFLGFSNHPAYCDRYDYRQKFEYWGVVVGGLLMGGTGLILWFSTFISKFIPAAVVPHARALHSNEALLAFLVIIIWHIYNAIFSPEVFPLDTSIFTGKISRERMIHEHPVELARIEGKTLEEITGHQPGHVQYETDKEQIISPGGCEEQA